MARKLSLKELRKYARAHNDTGLIESLRKRTIDKQNLSSVNKTFNVSDLPDGPFTPIFEKVSGNLLDLIEAAFAIMGYGYWYNKIPTIESGHYAQRGIPKAYKQFSSDRVEQMQNFDGLNEFFDFAEVFDKVSDNETVNGMNREKLFSLLNSYETVGELNTIDDFEKAGNAILETDLYDDFDL